MPYIPQRAEEEINRQETLPKYTNYSYKLNLGSFNIINMEGQIL